jgi:hypothetical protein
MPLKEPSSQSLAYLCSGRIRSENFGFPDVRFVVSFGAVDVPVGFVEEARACSDFVAG